VQKQFAANASYVLQPGDPFPAEGETPGVSDGPTAPAYPSATNSGSAAAASSSGAAATISHKSSFPPGAIAGVVVGAVAIIALAAALFYFVGRHRTVKAREAAGAALSGANEKGQSGGASPIPALPGQPVLGPGGMVYVPAQQHDYGYDNRMSMPPTYPAEAPSHPMTPHSPANPHYSTVSTYSMNSALPSPE
jgi:hypothetical protein